MKTKSLLFIIVAGIFWGTSCLFANGLSVYGITPIQMTAARGMVSFICMALFCLIARRGAFRTGLKSLLLFICGGIALFATATLYYVAMQETSVAVAVVLLYTSPVIVMAVSAFLFKERITKLKLISIFVMLIGSVLVSGIIGDVKINLLGALYGILSAICYTVYNILTKLQMKNGDDPYTATFYTFATICVVSLAVANPVDMVSKAAANPWPVIPLLIGIGIATFVIPYFLYTASLKELSVSTASTLSIIEPMTASILGMIFLEEIPTPLGIIGIILVLASVVMISLGEKKQHEKQESAPLPDSTAEENT